MKSKTTTLFFFQSTNFLFAYPNVSQSSFAQGSSSPICLFAQITFRTKYEHTKNNIRCYSTNYREILQRDMMLMMRTIQGSKVN